MKLRMLVSLLTRSLPTTQASADSLMRNAGRQAQKRQFQLTVAGSNEPHIMPVLERAMGSERGLGDRCSVRLELVTRSMSSTQWPLRFL